MDWTTLLPMGDIDARNAEECIILGVKRVANATRPAAAAISFENEF